MAHRATHARLPRGPDVPSSSRAWPRAVSVTRSPASMRAISSTRASPASASAATRARPARTLLVTRTWWLARAAIGARWVTQSTWRPSATAASFCATTEATRPPMPASTSSKTIVGTRSAFASTVVSPSIVRESSPPDATRASGRTSSPGLVESRNSTRSSPRGDTPSSSARSNQIRKWERSMPSARSSRSTAGPRRSAAARRRSESAVAACPSSAWSSPSRRSSAARISSWRESRSSSATTSSRNLSIASSVSPYFRLRRVSASSRSSITSRRPGSSGTDSRGARTAARGASSCARAASLGSTGGALPGARRRRWPGHALRGLLRVGEGIQELELAGGLEQALVLVLAVHLHEVVAQALEERDGDGRVVDEGTMAARATELTPRHKHAVVGREPRLVERRGHGAARLDVEDRLDRRGVGVAPDHVRLGARPEDQQDRVDEHRLSGAGFAGQDVEPRAELHGDALDDGEVSDAKLAEHRERC